MKALGLPCLSSIQDTRTPEGLQVLYSAHGSRVEEGITSLNLLTTLLNQNAAQDTNGFVGCRHTMPAHAKLYIHWYPLLLHCRPALDQFITWSVLTLGTAEMQPITLKLYWLVVQKHRVRRFSVLSHKYTFFMGKKE